MMEKEAQTQATPMWKIIFTQFREHRMAVFGLFIIFFFLMVSVMAPVISHFTGIDPDAQNVFRRFQPAMTSTVLPAEDQESEIESFLEDNPEQAAKLNTILNKKYERNSEEIVFELWEEMGHTAFQEILQKSPESEARALATLFSQFSTYHLLGTDQLGRDVLMRLIYGTRVSLAVGLFVAFCAAFIGLIIGSIAGFYGGWVDTALMRVTDALLSIPLIPVLIVIAAIDFNQLPIVKSLLVEEYESIIKMVLILCIFSWMTVARLVRSQVLAVREQEFVLASKTLGSKDFSIILNHMVPNVIAPLLVAVTLNVGESILYEAALSFLGLGIQPPTPSWGNMLNNAQELLQHAPALAFYPGFLIFLIVVSFNFIGDGLQDAMDPKSIRR